MLGITRENEVKQVQEEIKQEDVNYSNLDFLLSLTIKTMVILDWLLWGVVTGITGWEIKKLQLLYWRHCQNHSFGAGGYSCFSDVPVNIHE